MTCVGATVCVTGGCGFLGRHVCTELQRAGYRVVAPRRSDFDLRDIVQCESLYRLTQPECVVHCAAKVGGIGANQKYPGLYFWENAVMGMNVIEAGRRYGLSKFVQIGTCCSYPTVCQVPFRESSLFCGLPEVTNRAYGVSKLSLIAMCQAYRQQYGFNAISLIMANLYGPEDSFDPESSHVIPALIRKACSGDSTVWGSGTASREFLFVRDAARAIRLAVEHYDSPEPVNIGTGQEVTIQELAETIYEMCGCREPLAWDASKPDGQPRRCLDVSRAKSFGFTAETSLRDGLTETIEWWKRQR